MEPNEKKHKRCKNGLVSSKKSLHKYVNRLADYDNRSRLVNRRLVLSKSQISYY